jgi:uncharacterized protein YndB with AHSA1/START domain
MSEDQVLRIERTYEAPAEAVFDAWTSEEVLRRWWRAERDWETPEALVEPRVGGAIRNPRRSSDGADHGARGTYTEIERPRRLAFTWTWDGSERETLVEVDFAERDGATTVTFTHRGLADEESVRSHEYGWGNVLAELGRYLDGEDERPS